MKPGILVLDGQERAALAIVRSLSRAGYPVYVGSNSASSLASASRYVRRQGQIPDPLLTPSDFLPAVAGLMREWKVEFVLPVTDASILALSEADGELEPERILGPVPDSHRRISNKSVLLREAARIGIPIPRQVEVPNPAAVTRRDELELPYPVVLKPSRSVVSDGTGGKFGVGYAGNRAELEDRLAALPSAAYPVLVQERVQGPGVGLFLLRWEGELLASFSHRRLREKPPSGGVSVYRESIAVDPVLLRYSETLLSTFDWRGVAMVEFKLDRATGTPYLMEVNGRFWGSLQLAIDSGVNFPLLLVESTLGHRPRPIHHYRTGVRSRWLWGDADHLLARFKGSRQSLNLPPDAPGRVRTLIDFLALWRPGDRLEVLRLRDLGPFLHESFEWIRSALVRDR